MGDDASHRVRTGHAHAGSPAELSVQEVCSHDAPVMKLLQRSLFAEPIPPALPPDRKTGADDERNSDF